MQQNVKPVYIQKIIIFSGSHVSVTSGIITAVYSDAHA